MNPVIGVDAHTIGMRKTGNETYMRNLVEQFAEIAPSDLSFTYYNTLPKERVPAMQWNGPVKRLRPHSPMVRIPLSFPLALWRDKVQLAHFQYVIPPVASCPAIVSIHDISYEFFPDCFHPAERRRMKLLIPFSGRKAAHILTISEFSKQEMIRQYRLPADKITVTYLGASEAFRPMPDAARHVSEQFGLTGSYVLGVGNLQPRKNLIRLIKAYAALRLPGRIEHDLVLVGQPAWRGSDVFAEIERLGIGQWVRTTGYVSESDLVALYSAADVFVYPSIYEGFGLPVLEAMACGAPVITTHVSSLPEVAGDAAILVDPMSESELSHALERVIHDRALRSDLIARGFDQARRFSWRRTAEETLQAYRQHL